MSAIMEHDGRALNRMDPGTRIIHQRLEAWGRWAYDSALRPYPRDTVLSRMIEYGPLGAAQAGKPPISMPPEIAETDAAIAKLCVIDRKTVTAYYTREEPIESCARRCWMSLRKFQNVLRRARWRVSLILAGEDASGK